MTHVCIPPDRDDALDVMRPIHTRVEVIHRAGQSATGVEVDTPQEAPTSEPFAPCLEMALRALPAQRLLQGALSTIEVMERPSPAGTERVVRTMRNAALQTHLQQAALRHLVELSEESLSALREVVEKIKRVHGAGEVTRG